jgi:hypothetical protein
MSHQSGTRVSVAMLASARMERTAELATLHAVKRQAPPSMAKHSRCAGLSMRSCTDRTTCGPDAGFTSLSCGFSWGDAHVLSPVASSS